jgi:hypothetical protein
MESGLTVEMKVNPDSSRDTKILATTSAYFRSITTNVFLRQRGMAHILFSLATRRRKDTNVRDI